MSELLMHLFRAFKKRLNAYLFESEQRFQSKAIMQIASAIYIFKYLDFAVVGKLQTKDLRFGPRKYTQSKANKRAKKTDANQQ
jgi:hypothetical protein